MSEGHKWFASMYDWVQLYAERTFMRAIREEIVGGARGRILEVGAGTGASFPYYSDHAQEIIATEPDPCMLERAGAEAARPAAPVSICRGDRCSQRLTYLPA